MRRAAMLVLPAAVLLPFVFFATPAAIAAPSASAGPDGTVTVQLETTQVVCMGPGMSGGCNLVVDYSATAANLTNADLSVSNVVTGDATFESASGELTRTADITVSWPGVSNGYALIPPGSSITGTGTATFAYFIPEQGEPGPDQYLIQNFQVFPGAYPSLGSAETVTTSTQYTDNNGVPLPVLVDVGAPVTAAVVGGLLALLTVRRRRARAAPVVTDNAGG